MKINDVSQLCLSFASGLGREYEMLELIAELYDGPREEAHIANFLGSLHNANRRSLDEKLERMLMDYSPQTLTPDERLLLKIRSETAAGALPSLTGAICHRTAPDLDLMASSDEEALFWALTSFWSLVYTPGLMRAARMIHIGRNTLLSNCPL